MDTVIKAENLGKKYIIGHQKQRGGDSLRDAMTHTARGIWQRVRHPLSPNRESVDLEELWALKDIDFEVKQGERVGIIGRNGAGKSTLLKILSRVTEPTTGKVRIKGRVSSLLEVGTGFHPELTGRENIFLNGAILGMTRQEIKRKFDEIITFAELEKFLDTPVKRYSSGMYVRLAFAVAAHLEPEILIVDEVLAVGDAAFQKKCLSKMENVAKEGRTVLFVSHQMAAILNLCQRVILIDCGCIVADGANKKVVDQYLQTTSKTTNFSLAECLDRRGNQKLKFDAFELRSFSGLLVPHVYSGQDVTIALKYKSNTGRSLRNVHIAIGVHGNFNENLFHLSTNVASSDFDKIPPTGTILCKIPRLPLQPGKYSFNLFCVVAGETADWVENAGMIKVQAGDFFGSGKLPPPNQGALMVQHSWSIASASSHSLSPKS